LQRNHLTCDRPKDATSKFVEMIQTKKTCPGAEVLNPREAFKTKPQEVKK